MNSRSSAMKSCLRLFLSLAAAACLLLGFGLGAQEARPVPSAGAAPVTEAPTAVAGQADAPAPPEKAPGSKRRAGRRDLGSHAVASGASEVPEVVSLLGTTQVDGPVTHDAVAILGDTRVGPAGQVGGSAVAVLGRVESEGSVGHDAVSVLGGSRLNGEVGGQVVAILGDVHLGPKAVVNGDIVILGGRLTRDPGAVVRGNEVKVSVLGHHGGTEGLSTWFSECLLKGRPLAFHAQLLWAWAVAGLFLGFYLLLALLFPGAIERCVSTWETRPGGSLLAALVTVVASPVALTLLALTVVGLVVIPFAALGLMVAGLFGKAVILAWVGRRVLAVGGRRAPTPPVLAVLVGGVLVLLLYTLWGSLLLYKLLGWLGVGVVAYSVALALRRERPLPAAAVEAPAEPAAAGISVPAPGLASAGAESAVVGVPVVALPPAPPVTFIMPELPPLRPPEPAAITLPRAGFLLRLAALAIDGVVVGLLAALLSGVRSGVVPFHPGPGGFMLGLALYGAVLWKLRGTTIGGIVCHLRVVRLDQRNLDWPTVIVRALGCFLSLAVGGLGFLWVAFDGEKQSWHDKIAGTTVVVVPKGQSLL